MSLPGVPSHLQLYARFFLEAAKEKGVDAYLLAAVCERESRGGLALTPPGAAGKGDGGNGFGLMQIDARYHKEFCAGEDWKDARKNILKGAEVLAAAIKEFAGDTDAEFLGTCRYNASLKRISAALEKAKPNDRISRRMAADACTTGGNYGSWVFNRRASYLAKAVLA